MGLVGLFLVLTRRDCLGKQDKLLLVLPRTDYLYFPCGFPFIMLFGYLVTTLAICQGFSIEAKYTALRFHCDLCLLPSSAGGAAEPDGAS